MQTQYLKNDFPRTSKDYLTQNRIFSFVAYGFIFIAKRWIELIEQSELVIQKAIIDR